MTPTGRFFGIGVGPGETGLIPLAAWECLKDCDIIYTPRARTMDHSVARRCLPPNEIPEDRFREIEFTMESDRSVLSDHYAKLGEMVAAEVRAGKDVAWLTIGDPLTYSTYIYLLAAVKECVPGLHCRTFPGITSYSALAAAAGFALGEGKEQVLILPCPEEMPELREAIRAHDIVALMKIGKRLPAVLSLLHEMGISSHCTFGRHVGMEDEVIHTSVEDMATDAPLGYLSTMLIRKTPAKKRHIGGAP